MNDRPRDGPTDTVTKRVGCTRLKSRNLKKSKTTQCFVYLNEQTGTANIVRHAIQNMSQIRTKGVSSSHLVGHRLKILVFGYHNLLSLAHQSRLFHHVRGLGVDVLDSLLFSSIIKKKKLEQKTCDNTQKISMN